MKSNLILPIWAFAAFRLWASDMATVPMIVEGNRPFIQLSFKKQMALSGEHDSGLIRVGEASGLCENWHLPWG